MSTVLLDAALSYLRGQFSKREAVDVCDYGGEFAADEVAASTFNAPALLLSPMGWTPARGHERMVGRGALVCHMSCFVVTKGGRDRAERMRSACALAAKLNLALDAWVPSSEGLPLELAAPEPDVRAENLYGRKLDRAGLALWLVSWRQCAKLPPLGSPQWAALMDLEAVQITSYAANMVQSEETVPGVLPVAHELNFGAPPV
jgi:hypothetical protein